MVEKKSENETLDTLLRVSCEDAPLPSDELMSKVLADAITIQTGFSPTPATAPRPGFLNEFLRAVGGWPAMAGLATAAAAGLWLGAYPPGFLPDAAGAYLGLDDAAALIDTSDGLGFDLAGEAL